MELDSDPIGASLATPSNSTRYSYLHALQGMSPLAYLMSCTALLGFHLRQSRNTGSALKSRSEYRVTLDQDILIKKNKSGALLENFDVLSCKACKHAYRDSCVGPILSFGDGPVVYKKWLRKLSICLVPLLPPGSVTASITVSVSTCSMYSGQAWIWLGHGPAMTKVVPQLPRLGLPRFKERGPCFSKGQGLRLVVPGRV
ncbi:hypothetical protein Sjap_017872 [Stephania japonica]|uniref:Uncharacterized protein n=1 Tax=Stephania japonica TaxID=461633 RepID=A0AAP0I706_9MAGN